MLGCLTFSGKRFCTAVSSRMPLVNSTGPLPRRSPHSCRGTKGVRRAIEQPASREAEIWPAKITDVAESAYKIPINPSYASSLFDHDLASQTLFCSKPDVLIQDECVYYSGTNMGFPPSQAASFGTCLRVKVSTERVPRAGLFPSLIQAERGRAKTIFKKYRRFGVFDWRDVVKLAGGANEEITALRFSHSETFCKPIPWEDMRDDLKSAPAGPRPLEYSYFLKLYRQGMGL